MTFSKFHITMFSGVTGRGAAECPPPQDFWLGNFCWPIGEREAWKNGKGAEWRVERKRRKIVEGEVENWKWKDEKFQNEERTLFFFFFFSFCFSLFKKRRKFVLGVPKWKFSTWKKDFTLGKNSGKKTLPPHKNFPVTPWQCCMSYCCKNNESQVDDTSWTLGFPSLV